MNAATFLLIFIIVFGYVVLLRDNTRIQIRVLPRGYQFSRNLPEGIDTVRYILLQGRTTKSDCFSRVM
mgnify:CR=1 FL=1